MMKKLSADAFGVPTSAVATALLLLASACTGSVGPDNPGSGATGGTGASSGVGASAGTGATSNGGNGQGGSAPMAGTGGSVSAGTGGSGPNGGTGGTLIYPNPAPHAPAAAMLRRLTRPQFRNAIRDLLGYEVDISLLDADSSSQGNSATISAAFVHTPEPSVLRYHAAIEAAVESVFADATKRAAFLGCTPTGAADDACIRSVMQTKGRRAWRRPLEMAEVDRLATIASSAATALESPVEGARWATVALLESTNFLYRPELGAPQNGVHRLTPHQFASRLAFLTWNSLPDDTLLDLAESGGLATPEAIRTAAQRLLDTEAGRQSVTAFVDEYLTVYRIGTQPKDVVQYPNYSPALQDAMARDMRDTWAVLAFDDKVSIMDVFTTPKVVVNADLATLYGLDATGLTSTTFAVRSLPTDGPRLGVLSKAGFASMYANQKVGSPTLRGKFIREQLLCEHLEPPPEGVAFPGDPVGMTRRQQLEAHMTDPTCAGCHAMMDPLGFPLEVFDGIGQYRTTEAGFTIDTTGEYDGIPVANARELGAAIGASVTARNCLVRRYFAYAMGHEERPVDASVVNALGASFEASGFKLPTLILDIVAHDAFSIVSPQEP
jgi:hypothetical protein